MTVETQYKVFRMEAPTLEDKMLGKDQLEYEQEMTDIVHGLGRLAALYPGLSLSLEERRAVAYAIVGEDVPEVATRDVLRDHYWSDGVDFGRDSMRSLDGGYHAMWARARNA